MSPSRTAIEVDNSFLGQDLGDAVSRRMGKAPSLPDLPPSGGTKPKKATESEFQKYMENLEKQLQKTKELGVVEQVQADLALGHLKLQKGERADVLINLAEQIDAAKALTEYQDLSAAAAKTRDDALLKSALDQEALAKGLEDGNKSMRDEIELIGKSTEAQAAIEAARLSSTIALKEEELARKSGTGALIRDTEAIEAQIKLLKERQNLFIQKGVADQVKKDADEAKDFAKQVGAAFESSFEKAILEGDKLSDVLQGLAKDILGLYIRNSITGPLAKSIGTMGSSGGGLDFSGIFSSIGTWFSGLGFANGGNPPVGMASVVGENGPELFVPRTAGTIVPNHALGGGQAVNVTINNTIGDVATASMVRQAQAGTERRIMSQLRRSRSYAGEAA